MKSKFKCPACDQPLFVEWSKFIPLVAKYAVVGCDNPRCSSNVAQKDGGSGPTEEAAYLSLCNAVDNECEEQVNWQEKRERDKEAKADRDMDRERAGGP